MIHLLDILKLSGFNNKLPTRLVRHQHDKYPDIRRRNWFELYQAYQSRPKFHGAKQIVSFYALPGNRAGFYGVYKVLGHKPGRDGAILKECEYSARWNRKAEFFYNLERDDRFDHLRDRLIIDWGPGALAWVQKFRDKPVVEIQPPGRTLPVFEDYLDFSLTYAQLSDLFNHEEAHRDWQTSLSAVAGIYLILAERDGHGHQYVGSAYGAEGIWGRWREYKKSGHGGNAKLRKLLKQDQHYPKSFRFSVLQILPKTMTRAQVIEHETRYKLKLGSRATGLNAN